MPGGQSARAAISAMPQQEENHERDIDAICHELHCLYDQIPMFANWKIQQLEAVAWRYLQVLHDVIRISPYDQLCGAQVRSLPEIMSQIRKAASSGHWSHFNSASVALGWDIEALIDIICKCGRKL